MKEAFEATSPESKSRTVYHTFFRFNLRHCAHVLMGYDLNVFKTTFMSSSGPHKRVPMGLPTLSALRMEQELVGARGSVASKIPFSEKEP